MIGAIETMQVEVDMPEEKESERRMRRVGRKGRSRITTSISLDNELVTF